MKSSLTLSTSVAVLALIGCRAESPALTGSKVVTAPVAYAPAKPDPKTFPAEFGFAKSEKTVEQERYDENKITANFQVLKDGASVNGLTERDFSVKENGLAVTQFKMASKSERLDQVAEIAFTVDITGSMGRFIESAKLRLKDFIVTSRKNGYHIRMCLSTFGDFVVKKCDRFFDNTSDEQVKEFISELTQISIAKKQGEVEPFIDLPENAMRAVTSATSSTEWTQGSQRFMILVTDADFYSPDKPTAFLDQHQACTGCGPGQDTSAPTMAEVTQAIQNSQVRIFAVTPKSAGYNSPLNGQPGIAQSSAGEFFEFQPVLKGQISIDSILNRILRRINTNYKLTYVVDQNRGLDPTLSQDKRNISISTANGAVTLKEITSSMPTGRPQYQQTWKISDQPIQTDSVEVYVNDRLLTSQHYSVSRDSVTFKSVPEPGAKLRFAFYYEAIEKNLRQQLITLPTKVDARTAKVFINGIEARDVDVVFSPTMEGSTNVSLSGTATAAHDPYNIRQNKGAKVQVVTNFSK